MPPLLRTIMMSVLMVIRCLLWVVGSVLLALLLFVSFTLPQVPKEGLGGHVERTWDGSVAWLDLKVFNQRYIATETVTFIVDPGCKTALGRATYAAVVNCGKQCARYPRPTCEPPTRLISVGRLH